MASAPLALQVPLPWERPRPAPLPPPPPAAPAEREDLARLRAALGEHARQVWSGRELLRRHEREIRTWVATGLAPLDRLLAGGLERGRLTALTGRGSSGRWSAVVAALAGITGCGEPAALVDHGNHFDPETAANAGVDLARLLWVAPQRMKDCVASAELLLGAGFPLVVLECGVRPRGARVPDASWIRLARAATSHASVLLVSSPWPLAGTAADASLRATRGRPTWNRLGGAPPLLESIAAELEVEKHRHVREGRREGARWRI
jgi:hypothetical protein